MSNFSTLVQQNYVEQNSQISSILDDEHGHLLFPRNLQLNYSGSRSNQKSGFKSPFFCSSGGQQELNDAKQTNLMFQFRPETFQQIKFGEKIEQKPSPKSPKKRAETKEGTRTRVDLMPPYNPIRLSTQQCPNRKKELSLSESQSAIIQVHEAYKNHIQENYYEPNMDKSYIALETDTSLTMQGYSKLKQKRKKEKEIEQRLLSNKAKAMLETNPGRLIQDIMCLRNALARDDSKEYYPGEGKAQREKINAIMKTIDSTLNQQLIDFQEVDDLYELIDESKKQTNEPSEATTSLLPSPQYPLRSQFAFTASKSAEGQEKPEQTLEDPESPEKDMNFSPDPKSSLNFDDQPKSLLDRLLQASAPQSGILDSGNGPLTSESLQKILGDPSLINKAQLISQLIQQNEDILKSPKPAPEDRKKSVLLTHQEKVKNDIRQRSRRQMNRTLYSKTLAPEKEEASKIFVQISNESHSADKSQDFVFEKTNSIEQTFRQTEYDQTREVKDAIAISEHHEQLMVNLNLANIKKKEYSGFGGEETQIKHVQSLEKHSSQLQSSKVFSNVSGQRGSKRDISIVHEHEGSGSKDESKRSSPAIKFKLASFVEDRSPSPNSKEDTVQIKETIENLQPEISKQDIDKSDLKKESSIIIQTDPDLKQQDELPSESSPLESEIHDLLSGNMNKISSQVNDISLCLVQSPTSALAEQQQRVMEQEQFNNYFQSLRSCSVPRTLQFSGRSLQQKCQVAKNTYRDYVNLVMQNLNKEPRPPTFQRWQVELQTRTPNSKFSIKPIQTRELSRIGNFEKYKNEFSPTIKHSVLDSRKRNLQIQSEMSSNPGQGNESVDTRMKTGQGFISFKNMHNIESKYLSLNQGSVPLRNPSPQNSDFGSSQISRVSPKITQPVIKLSGSPNAQRVRKLKIGELNLSKHQKRVSHQGVLALPNVQGKGNLQEVQLEVLATQIRHQYTDEQYQLKMIAEKINLNQNRERDNANGKLTAQSARKEKQDFELKELVITQTSNDQISRTKPQSKRLNFAAHRSKSISRPNESLDVRRNSQLTDKLQLISSKANSPRSVFQHPQALQLKVANPQSINQDLPQQSSQFKVNDSSQNQNSSRRPLAPKSQFSNIQPLRLSIQIPNDAPDKIEGLPLEDFTKDSFSQERPTSRSNLMQSSQILNPMQVHSALRELQELDNTITKRNQESNFAPSSRFCSTQKPSQNTAQRPVPLLATKKISQQLGRRNINFKMMNSRILTKQLKNMNRKKLELEERVRGAPSSRKLQYRSTKNNPLPSSSVSPLTTGRNHYAQKEFLPFEQRNDVVKPKLDLQSLPKTPKTRECHHTQLKTQASEKIRQLSEEKPMQIKSTKKNTLSRKMSKDFTSKENSARDFTTEKKLLLLSDQGAKLSKNDTDKKDLKSNSPIPGQIIIQIDDSNGSNSLRAHDEASDSKIPANIFGSFEDCPSKKRRHRKKKNSVDPMLHFLNKFKQDADYFAPRNLSRGRNRLDKQGLLLASNFLRVNLRRQDQVKKELNFLNAQNKEIQTYLSRCPGDYQPITTRQTNLDRTASIHQASLEDHNSTLKASYTPFDSINSSKIKHTPPKSIHIQEYQPRQFKAIGGRISRQKSPDPSVPESTLGKITHGSVKVTDLISRLSSNRRCELDKIADMYIKEVMKTEQ